MTSRERVLAIGVGVVVGLFGLQTAFSTINGRLQAKQDAVDKARGEAEAMKRIETAGTIADRQLRQLNLKSLPTNQEALVTQYKAWLTKTALDVGVTDILITPPERPMETKAYKEYKFGLTGECRLDQWIELLAAYYDADFLHRLDHVSFKFNKDFKTIRISLDSHALALKGAPEKQPASDKPSGRLNMSAEEYKQVILGRNPFSPPNKAPTFAGPSTFEIPRGTPWEQILKAEDAENQNIQLSLEGEELPAGLNLLGKTLKWTPTENGQFEIAMRVADDGWPKSSLLQKLTLKVVDPPAAPEPAPEPEKFDVATQAFVTGMVSGRNGREVWIHSRTDGGRPKLSVGSTFEIGSVKGKVIDINLQEDFVEIESDGVRWTAGIGTSLADAYARSKTD